MADPAPPHEPPAPGERRFFWPGGLSARLLILTVIIVALANLLILPPNLAAFEQQWLLDRLRAAELASSLDFFNVPQREKDEVLAAFAAHKGEVTEGSLANTAR